YMSKKLRPDHWFDVVVEDLWIPDAFIGPMASLMEAIQTDGVPVTAARDNLDTLRTLFAAYRSMETHRVVAPIDID
ncbi:MAG: gfo/Idh/MocA family oxidoreductase, partial [Chloroflexota bacterium]|nr:gfo/Idh/MocA family oxidoreductase [Chloroflexota bacterium]